MKKVYCICGLGSDERIFSKLEWNNIDVHYLHWITPEKNESLNAYARRMCAAIKEDNITLIGVSFGGILSIEIAKLITVNKLILISSIQTHHQLPGWMKACGKLKLNSLIPKGRLHDVRPLKLFAPIENYFLGAVTQEEKTLAHEYRLNINPDYLKWSIHQILNWKNEWVPENTYHLHGTDDKIFPIHKVAPTHTIASGRHFMVFHCPEKISAVLKEII